jgi:hypothetical protein
MAEPTMEDLMTGRVTLLNGSQNYSGEGGLFPWQPQVGNIYQDQSGVQWIYSSSGFMQLGGNGNGNGNGGTDTTTTTPGGPPTSWESKFMKSYPEVAKLVKGGTWANATQFANAWKDYTGRNYGGSSDKDPRFKEFANTGAFKPLPSAAKSDGPTTGKQANTLRDMGISSLYGMGGEVKHFYNQPVQWKPGKLSDK